MNVRKIVGVLLLAGLLTGAGGCAYPVSKQVRKEARKGLTFQMVLKNPSDYANSVVIWGGQIISTENLKEGTRLTVLQTPLDSGLAPREAERTQGRFIALTPAFLDPMIYMDGRRLTIAGVIAGQETQPLGAGQYAYPVIKIREIYIWRREIAYYDYPYYYDHGYYPYPGPFFRGGFEFERHEGREGGGEFHGGGGHSRGR